MNKPTIINISNVMASNLHNEIKIVGEKRFFIRFKISLMFLKAFMLINPFETKIDLVENNRG